LIAKVKPRFIEPMLLLRMERLPEGPEWVYENQAGRLPCPCLQNGGKLSLRSRNDNDFALRSPSIAKALASLPDDTAVDGEIVALDETGKPSFNALQNYGSSKPDLIRPYWTVTVPQPVIHVTDDQPIQDTTTICISVTQELWPPALKPVCSVSLSTTVVDRRLGAAIRVSGSGSAEHETGAFFAIATSGEDAQRRTIRAREGG
jgi:hypothetical protein